MVEEAEIFLVVKVKLRMYSVTTYRWSGDAMWLPSSYLVNVSSSSFRVNSYQTSLKLRFFISWLSF